MWNRDFEIIAVDLDGTLLEPNGVILGEVRETFNKLCANGMKVVIASGRPFHHIESMLLNNQIDFSELGYPHALIANERDIYFLEKSSYLPWSQWNNKLLVKERALLSLSTGVLSRLKATQETKSHPCWRYDDEKTEQERGFPALIFETVDHAVEAKKDLEREEDLARVQLRPYRNKQIISLRYSEISKGNTLSHLIRQLACSPDRVLAIGDSENDEDMLNGTYGFASAAPANADERIKQIVKKTGGYVVKAAFGRGVIGICKQVMSLTVPVQRKADTSLPENELSV